MRVAYQLASQSLPKYSSKFSRKDFTLPQLFACLTLKEMLKRSYRGAEALLTDSESWLRDIGLDRAPDHNTLCRAAAFLFTKLRVNKLLDTLGQWAAVARLVGLSRKPLAIDSSMYESHHVSRHYERRRQDSRKRSKGKGAGKGRKTGRSTTVKRLPKIAIGVSGHSHLILSLWTGTGGGADHPHFEPVLHDARKRIGRKRFTAVLDAGYDSEAGHELARAIGIRTIIPPNAGRPRKDGGPPGGRWRRRMKKLLSTKQSRQRSGYTQRWQSETVHSMMKRNLGSELSGKTARSRLRDLRLKSITHDLMVV
jgi:hypothetical protein